MTKQNGPRYSDSFVFPEKKKIEDFDRFNGEEIEDFDRVDGEALK